MSNALDTNLMEALGFTYRSLYNKSDAPDPDIYFESRLPDVCLLNYHRRYLHAYTQVSRLRIFATILGVHEVRAGPGAPCQLPTLQAPVLATLSVFFFFQNAPALASHVCSVCVAALGQNNRKRGRRKLAHQF